MYTCLKVKQRLNELKIKEKRAIIEIKKEEISEFNIEELKECGYSVKEINNKIIISE